MLAEVQPSLTDGPRFDRCASRLRLVAVALLVVGAALFAIGTSVEKSSHDQSAEGIGTTGEGHDEEAGAAEGHSDEAAPTVEPAHSEKGEARIFGIDRESNGLVATAVAVSLFLAALLWFQPRLVVWVAIALASIAFTVFDIAEVAHQIDVSKSGLALLAAAVALAHVGVAGAAVAGARRTAAV